MSESNLFWSPFPLFSSPGAWHSWTLRLVIIYSWLWYPARYHIQNCLKTLSFYLWLLKWKSLFGKHNLQYKCFSQRASSKSYFFCFLQTMAFWRTQRHTDAVSEWLESGETFHVMRDHPDHNAPMPQEWTKLISNVIRKISYHLPSFQGLCCYQPSSHCSICNKLFLKDCKSKQLFKERSGFRFGKIFWMTRQTLPIN